MAIDEADVLFTHAEANRPYLSRRAQAGTPLNVVHRGIPISIDAADSPQRDRNLWLTAAALYPSKNVASVIRAFARAYGHDAKLRLEIFGDGPDRARLEKLAAALVPDGAVRFCGHVSRENLMARMQQAALFLLLSTKPSERLPNVIKEAMLAGCSIIVSQSEGIEELIPDTALGKIVNADDEPAIDRAVAELAGEPAAAAAVRRTAARHLIEQKFSAAHSMQQYCAAWAAAQSAADGPALPMGTAE
nr:glycosyltransferase [Allopontixanthobacter confluentis]